MLLHPSTEKSINNFISEPSHALLIKGPDGSGKGSIAELIGSKLLDIDLSKLEFHPYVLWLKGEPITIENIREAQKLMQLKTPGQNKVRRLVIAEQAGTMSLEAQNAFLKLLEEPPADTVIILTVSAAEQLLPTIKSRVQNISVLAPSLESVIQFYNGKYPDTDIQKAYHLSEGYMGLLSAILNNDTDEHPLVEQIQIAKTILANDTFGRLIQIDKITKEKNTPLLLKALERICHAALVQSAKSNAPATESWKNRLKLIVNAEESLKHNPSAKLLLTDLFINL